MLPVFYELYLTTTGPDSKLNSRAINIFTLYALMDYSFVGLKQVTWEGPLTTSMGHRLLFQNKIVFLSLKIVFVLANSVDPDEMPHSKAFHLGLHCL